MSNNLIALQNKFLGQGQTVYDELSRLHDAQGYISDENILELAQRHNLPPSHVGRHVTMTGRFRPSSAPATSRSATPSRRTSTMSPIALSRARRRSAIREPVTVSTTSVVGIGNKKGLVSFR